MSAASNVVEPEAEDQSSGNTRQFVTFHVDRETYAVPLAEVQEIIRLPEMVEVPLAPRSLAGLANLRGNVLPVQASGGCSTCPTPSTTTPPASW